MIILKKIDNSKKAAYNKGKYKDPGAGLYVKILDCVYAKNGKIPNDDKELNDSIKSKDYIQGVDLLKEVYLQVGNDIKNSPYGVTPYNRSGCKLPHHLIKNDSLVLSVPLVKYAYLQLWKQGGLMKNASSELKSMKRHLDTHLKELGIRMEWHHGQMCWFEHGSIDEIAMCIMESNFNDIFLYLMESSGINLFEENFFTEASHGKLKYDLSIMEKYKNNDFNIKKTKHNHLYESVEFPSLNGDNTHLTSNIWKEIGEKTPEALYKWMFNNIEYDKTIKGWKLKSPEDVYKTKKGNCHDQSLFSSLLLHSLNFICGQLFFVEGEVFVTDIPYGNGHTLTWYRIDTPNEDFKYSFYWLETAWEDQLGIHGPYNDMDGLKHAVIEAYRKDNDINSHNKSFNNTISISTTSTYRIGMDLAKYVSSWRQMQQIQTSDDNIEIKDNIDNQINESMRMIDDMINSIYESNEIIDKKKEKFVPIFGIVKSYSSSQLRNDGTQKSDSELASVKFDKMIHKLTRGDNYSHALVSFDISLKEMYSYEDEGFVVDNIMEKESWLSTKSIYICVMFVKKSDRDRMKDFVSELKSNPEQTKYAMGNLIKAYIATPTKADKRFVCSSFTGYIMQCANPKNLHRDFSRLRPDDITVLPRSFYVANVVDRNDFISRFEEIKNKVKLIYKEYKDEIEEYNNQLPKIMLSDKMQELKTIDKILDWIVNKLA